MATNPTSSQLREMTGCLCFDLRRAARAVTQFYDAALKPYGLRATQMPILVAASLRGVVQMAPLSEILGMDRTTLLRNLRPLARRNLVVVSPGTDSRRREIRATEAGRALLARIYPPWRRAQSRTREILRDPALSGMLRELAESVRSGPRARPVQSRRS
jgi:DNA-binding MarR family transcriptional regulator